MKIKYLFLLGLFIYPALLQAQNKEIIAYYPEFREGNRSYHAKDLEKRNSAFKLTMLIYSFVEPGPDSSGKIIPKFMNAFTDYEEPYSSEMSIDGIADDTAQALRGQFNQLKKLKARHPNLKILMSIGGWTGSKYYSDLALTPQSRENFVDTCISLFIKGNLPIENGAGGNGVAKGIFDGFDLDWEFPISGGDVGIHNNINDTKNFTALFALFRKKLDEIKPGYFLTAAIAANTSDFYKYALVEDQKYVDWYNMMTYDYHGNWESITGHHSNLLSSPFDTTFGNVKLSFDHTVRYLLDTLHVSSDKIVPGAAFYGKGWGEVDSTNFGLYQQGKSGTDGVYARFENYTDFSDALKQGFEPRWDPISMAGWFYNPKHKVFWTYDDIRSVALKARYVDAYNLRGLMFWDITGDDTMGNLVSTIYRRNVPDFIYFTNNKNNKPPEVKIIEPLGSDSILTRSNLVIQTIVSDDGYVAKVEFFIDGQSIGYNTISPFDWVWMNTTAGKHEIKAVATDNNGAQTTSLPIEINVIKN